jgi:hypothetical protein
MKPPSNSTDAGLAQVAMRLAEHGRKRVANEAGLPSILFSPGSLIGTRSKNWFSIRLL